MMVGLNAIASLVAIPLTIDDLKDVLALQVKHKIIIGKGSNIFLKKDNYDENYLFIVCDHVNTLVIKDNEMIVDCGTSLHQLAWTSCAHQIGGYEFCEDIPGTLGGALIMNAGQYEFTISQYVQWVDVYDLESLSVKRIIPDEHFFGYRSSSFNSNQVILRASLKVQTAKQEDILQKIFNYKKNRYAKQPLEFANAGSVFKRPQKDGDVLYVWKLLEDCGLRAYRINDAMISDKHPGFIVNLGNASPSDIASIINLCQQKVKEKYDVKLELEWKVIE